MPTRILREGIITSVAVNALSDRAENFYRRLMSVVDDYGRYFAHPALLRAACYPLKLDSVSESDIAPMLQECVDQGLVKIYHQGTHLMVGKFGQQIRGKSKFPEPTDVDLLSKCTANAKRMRSESESETKSKTYTQAEAEADPPRASVRESAEPSELERPGCTGGNHNPTASAQRALRMKPILEKLYNRTSGICWPYQEEFALAEIAKNETCESELQELIQFRNRCEPRYFPNSLPRLLDTWTGTLDRARQDPNGGKPTEKTLDEKIIDGMRYRRFKPPTE